MRRMDDLLQGFVAQHRMNCQAQPTSLATKSARNLPPPGRLLPGFLVFGHIPINLFHLYMNVSYHPHAINIITVNMS